MHIVLKREAKKFLESNKDKIDFLYIDGSLDAEYVKSCGCCGPPPSPDYAVTIARYDSPTSIQVEPGVKVVEKIVTFKITQQFFDAIETARMSIVIFFLQDVGAPDDEGILVAKII
ncbi:MAG: hypothetical protein ACTSUE_20285 [Promethearchaeota archaeon]